MNCDDYRIGIQVRIKNKGKLVAAEYLRPMLKIGRYVFDIEVRNDYPNWITEKW